MLLLLYVILRVKDWFGDVWRAKGNTELQAPIRVVHGSLQVFIKR